MAFIALSIIGFFTGLIATYIFEITLKSNKRWRDRYYKRNQTIFGYHFHHSTYGLGAIAVGAGYLFSTTPLASFFPFWAGIGIITMHTISEKRFVFIEKQRNK